MTYEMPQQLEYKEKIVFGWTAKQLAYALAFGGPALLLIKIKLNLVTGTIALLLCTIAGLFMYLDLDTKIKDFLAYQKFREAFLLTKEMDEFVGVEGVSDGVIEAFY